MINLSVKEFSKGLKAYLESISITEQEVLEILYKNIPADIINRFAEIEAENRALREQVAANTKTLNTNEHSSNICNAIFIVNFSTILTLFLLLLYLYYHFIKCIYNMFDKEVLFIQ